MNKDKIFEQLIFMLVLIFHLLAEEDFSNEWFLPDTGLYSIGQL